MLHLLKILVFQIECDTLLVAFDCMEEFPPRVGAANG